MNQDDASVVDYELLSELLLELKYLEHPSNFHGLLCGALCVVPEDILNAEKLLEEGTGNSGLEVDLNARQMLRKLCADTNAELLSSDMAFEPLLPVDEYSLSQRVEALAAWCNGFLYGVSSYRSLDFQSMSEEARETLKDFTDFTQAAFDSGEDLETEENAFMELVEYVRVGAQLVFLELRPRPPATDEESGTVH